VAACALVAIAAISAGASARITTVWLTRERHLELLLNRSITMVSFPREERRWPIHGSQLALVASSLMQSHSMASV